jgi:hypothetical protein
VILEVQASFMRPEESCITADGNHFKHFLQEMLCFTPVDTKILQSNYVYFTIRIRQVRRTLELLSRI